LVSTYRWGYKPQEYFCFEVNAGSDVNGLLEFSTSDGKEIADLLTDYSAAYLKEKEIEDSKLGVETGPSISQTSSEAAAPAPTEKRRKSASKATADNGKGKTQTVKRAPAPEVSEPDHAPPPVPKSRPPSSQPPPPPKAPPPTSRPVSGSSDVDSAAAKIQSRFRGYSVRKEFTEEESAIIIQANYRGYRDRVMVSAMIEEILANEDY
jgi:hypothetical protein